MTQRILAISGSLRRTSTKPAFNPDLDGDASPVQVIAFRAALDA